MTMFPPRLVPLLVVVLLEPSVVLAADFSGTWSIASSVGTTPVTISCELVQSGSTLSGSCRPQVDGIPATDLTGMVDGSSAKWVMTSSSTATPAASSTKPRSSQTAR